MSPSWDSRGEEQIATMTGNGKQQRIWAGRAYVQAIANDPRARQAVVDLRELAQRIQTKGAALGKVLTALRQVFVVLDQRVGAEFEELRAERDRAPLPSSPSRYRDRCWRRLRTSPPGALIRRKG